MIEATPTLDREESIAFIKRMLKKSKSKPSKSDLFFIEALDAGMKKVK